MATSTTVRISESSHALLSELAERSQQSMQHVIAEALEEYRKRLFWQQARRDFEQLRSDPEAWQAEQKELAVWDQTIADGLSADGDTGP
jgi:predicted transcriptional regulator